MSVSRDGTAPPTATLIVKLPCMLIRTEVPSGTPNPCCMLSPIMPCKVKCTLAISVVSVGSKLTNVNVTLCVVIGVSNLVVTIVTPPSKPPRVTTNDSAALVKLKVVKPSTGAATSLNTALYPARGVCEVKVVSRHTVTVSFAVTNTVCTNAPAGTGSPAR